MKRVFIYSVSITLLASLSLGQILYKTQPAQTPADSLPTETFSVISNTGDVKEKKQGWFFKLSRADQIPIDRLNEETASYMEGYIQSQIDANYYEYNVIVYVKDQVVFLYNLPNDERIGRSIIAFVSDMPDVKGVKVEPMSEEIANRIKDKYKRPRIKGVWFPEASVLFPPLVANPREANYSIGYRYGDRVLGKRIIPISLGDIFPVFRWNDVFIWHGDLQIDISACVWGVFQFDDQKTPKDEWAELVNTDYMLSIPITYAFDSWAYRLRLYHISSHLGDEYLVNTKNVIRLNPSFEAIDLISSCQVHDGVRLYFGPGVVVNSDNLFDMKRFYLDYGMELRALGMKSFYHKLYGSPFIAIDVQNWQATNYRFSINMQVGYEWSKLQSAGRKVRMFIEYHNGNSEGQFFKEKTEYTAFRVSWGF